ncbi:MAG TPA: hypothetical protein VFB72_08645, partial [Verrucomicrobiae bacterium]|nr:hypothetical protein [Verrucomicrobiae bacterium]
NSSCIIAIYAGTGIDAFNISLGITAPASVQGGGIKDVLTVYGSSASETIAITNSTVGITSADTVTYNGMTAVIVDGTGGNDTFDVQGINTPTTINTGPGVNTVDVSFNAIYALLNVNGNGSDIMNVYAGASPVTLSSSRVNLTGLGGLDGIDYTGLSALNLFVSGPGVGNSVDITSTNAGTTTTVTTLGGGVDYIVGYDGANGTVLSGIQGPLIINGSGADNLYIDNSGAASGQSGTLTPTQLTGLGMGASGITYTRMALLNITLGGYNDNFTINDINSATATTVDGSGGVNTATVHFAQDFNGTLNLYNFQNGTLTVGRDFNGTLTDTGGLQKVTIGRNFNGTLNVGALGTLTIGGNSPGDIIANTIGTIGVNNGSGNVLLNVTQGGVQREIQASPVYGSTMPSSVTFKFLYAGSVGNSPQLAIRVTNPGVVRFDLALVTYSATAKFNLCLLDASGNAGLRNITVEGNILNFINAPSLAFFGLDARSQPGVVLPQEDIAGVEASGSIPVDVITVGGIEAVAFGTLLGTNGLPIAVSNVVGSHLDPGILSNLLGPGTTLIPPVDMLRLPSLQGINSSLYIYSTSNRLMNYANLFTNQVADDNSLTTFVDIPTGRQVGTPLLTTQL